MQGQNEKSPCRTTGRRIRYRQALGQACCFSFRPIYVKKRRPKMSVGSSLKGGPTVPLILVPAVITFFCFTVWWRRRWSFLIRRFFLFFGLPGVSSGVGVIRIFGHFLFPGLKRSNCIADFVQRINFRFAGWKFVGLGHCVGVHLFGESYRVEPKFSGWLTRRQRIMFLR